MLLALRRSAADVRYVVAAIGLALMLTLPVVSGVQKLQSLRADASGPAVVAPRVADDAHRVRSPHSRATAAVRGCRTPTARHAVRCSVARASCARRASSRCCRRMLLVWMSGVIDAEPAAADRMDLGAAAAHARQCRPPATRGRAMATRLSRRLHIAAPITLLESTLVDVPTVIGWLKPVVLLPASALAALSPQQLEAILAHELAHIRRHDYLVNLLQTLVETLLFYHPAVWWLSRRIRIERENCCDDLAVSLCGDPVAYASALADLEALRSEPRRRITSRWPRPAARSCSASAVCSARPRRTRPRTGVAGGQRRAAADRRHRARRRRPRRRPARPARRRRHRTSTARPSRKPPRAARPAPPMAAPTAGAVDAACVELATSHRRDASALRRADAAAADDGARSPAPGRSRRDRALPSQRGHGGAGIRREPVGGPRRQSRPCGRIDSGGRGAGLATAVIAADRSREHQPARQHESTGNWSWSNNGEKLQVSYSRRVRVHRRRHRRPRDVRRRLPEDFGSARGSAGTRSRSASATASSSAATTSTAPSGRSSRKAGVAARQPAEVRAQHRHRRAGRVARFLKSGGASAVMAEIARIDSSYVKGIYFTELFKQATLTPEQYRQAMAQASREMKSDYELASLLISIADRLPNDETSRDAYFTAAAGISSDYELRRVYSTMLKRGPVSSQTLAGILDAFRHDRIRLRAVGAAAADHVAADARRQEPRRRSSRRSRRSAATTSGTAS